MAKELDEYLNIVNYLCERLNFPKDKLKIDNKSVNEQFVCYFSLDDSPISFDLILDSYPKFNVFLTIIDKYSPKQHYFSLDGANFNERWIDRVKFNLDKLNGTLDYYVEWSRVQSDWGISMHGANAFIRDLRGLLRLNETIHILKIMHIREDDNYRAFSYGIFDYKNNEWLIYPYCGSLDSGGGHVAYSYIETITKELSKKAKFNLIELTLDANDFKEKLNIKKEFINEYNSLNYSFSELSFIKTSPNWAKEILDNIEKDEFIKALRDMRILINDQCKEIIRKSKLTYDFQKNDKILSIYTFLIKEGVTSSFYLKYFESFLNIANNANHALPENFWKDFKNGEIYDKNEVLLSTLYLGKIIIVYLDSVLDDKNGPRNG